MIPSPCKTKTHTSLNKNLITVTKLSGLNVRQSQYKSGQICRNVNQENAMNHGPVNFLYLL
jgi:hypothetical protein